MGYEFWSGVAYSDAVENAAGPRQITPGTKLDDKYRIEQLLAVGGMGAVYLGTHTGLRKRVAIKILNPQTSSTAMVERFHREAITASQIGHEGIAQVTDFGTSYEGEPFLVMEYLEGESLAARLSTSGRLPIEIACELGCAILAPLAAAHEAGIVHRDLKPDNVFLVRQSRGEIVKLLDFGISRAPGLEGEFRLTKTGLVLGTPYYMSPEQARGESEVGTAADLYAFGVMLYEMLVGKVPIEGENYNQLMYRVMTAEYAQPRVERPEIPEELERIILQAMALEPKKRPATATEIEHRLLAFCRPTFRDHQIERISSSSAGFSLQALNAAVTTPMPVPLSSGGRDSRDRVRIDTPPAVPTPNLKRTPLSESALIEAATMEAPVLLPRRRAPLWIAGAAVVLISGIVGALVIARPRGGETPGETQEPPTVAPAPPSATPEPPSAPPTPGDPAASAVPEAPASRTEITLRFSTDPATASIELDDAPVAGRQITVPKDEVSHRLRISAPGFVTRVDEIRFDENQRLVVQLKRTSRAPHVPDKEKDQRKPERIDVKSPY